MTETDRCRRRRAIFSGPSFEEKDLASVCASLACASLNLVCERVVCSMEEIQFPFTCCFIPESVFPPLTSSPAQPLKRFWPMCMEKILFGLDIFRKNRNFSDMNAIVSVSECLETSHIFKTQEQKCKKGLSGLCWGQAGNGGVNFWSKGRCWDSGETEFLSPHLSPPSSTLSLESWFTPFQMLLLGIDAL